MEAQKGQIDGHRFVGELNIEKGKLLMTQESLKVKVCIEFHKLTVFIVDAVERLKYYLMCHVKKPVRYTIR